MKKVILSIILIVIMINTTPIIFSKEIPISNDTLEEKIVKIAILGQEGLIISGDVYCFVEALTNYQWIAGNIKYIFDVKLVFDNDILKGNVKTENYDMIVVPGGSVGDTESFIRCRPSLQNFKWKNNLASFIKNGGGYYSVCGGTALITDLDLDRKPRSFAEYAYEKSALGVTWVKSHYETIAFPFLCQIGGLSPEYIGVAAYVMLSGWNISDYNIYRHSGVCLDCPIIKNNPIFDDFIENTRRIRWVGGPCLVIPENPDRVVKILANYPDEEMSDNVSTRVHAWKYTGGIRGIIKAYFDSWKNNYISGFESPLAKIYAFLTDWEMTDKIIETDFSKQPAMTYEIYPNEKQARILMTGLHPEYGTWWGGHIKETEDTSNNNLFDALHRWVDITPNNETFEDEYNYWINLRCVSWVAKIPDNDLPPIYGPSQVSDIYPYEQELNFIIYGNSEIANGTESLDLYYRHSVDNSSWDNWKLYEIDTEVSDGWSWVFNAPNGPGYYEFYSIRNVVYGDITENETAPPGADAIVYINPN